MRKLFYTNTGLSFKFLLTFILFFYLISLNAQAPVWHTADQQSNVGSGNSLSVNRPNNLVSGDLVILFLTQQMSSSNANTPGFTTPTGFTLLRTEYTTATTNAPGVTVYYKIATSSEPATYTSTVSTYDGFTPQWKAVAARITGHNPSNPISVNSGANSGINYQSSINSPQLNIPNSNSLMVSVTVGRIQYTSANAPSGMVSQIGINGTGSSDSNNNQPAIGIATENITNTGFTGDRSWTSIVPATRLANIMFAINRGTPVQQSVVTFNKPGTYNFVVPIGVTSIEVECWGAGGGSGGSSASSGGGGGGGGGYSRSTISVTPNSIIPLTIGSGGAGGLASGQGNTDGLNGGDTFFNNTTTVLAKGGQGGIRGDNGGNGGVGGSFAQGVGTVKFAGGNGGSGGSSGGGGGGSSAGSSANGSNGNNNAGNGGIAPTNGGNGGNGSSSGIGQNGFFPGGGAGGSDDVSSSNGNGVSGSNGRIVIRYNLSNLYPGGVAGSSIWLKSDAGVSTGSNFTWADQSGNNRNAIQNNASNQPSLLVSNSNFNPTLNFDGTNDFLSIQNLTGLPIGAASIEQFSVARNNNPSGNWQHIMSYGSPNTAQAFGIVKNAGNANAVGMFYTVDAISSFLEFANNNLALVGARYESNFGWISSFGRDRNSINFTANKTTANGYVGVDPALASSTHWSGQIAENIIFPRVLSENEALRVDSYLSLKYGITLDQATPLNYLASNNAVVWNGTANSSHRFNIAGIIRDDISNLNQKQSRSVNIGLQVTIGNGEQIATTNQLNTSSFDTDISALVWGDNNGAVNAWTSTGAPTGYEILQRSWKVQESGTVGSVKIQVPDNILSNGLPDEGARNVVLLVDNDSNFSSGATVYNMTLVNDRWETNVDLTNGQYFTFGVCTPEVITFVLGASSGRCQGNQTITYTANASGGSPIVYSLDETSLIAGNIINANTGEVNFVSTWTGTSTITATVSSCGVSNEFHMVETSPIVTPPVFDLGTSSQRCKQSESITYQANSPNATNINYSLDAVSLAAGNSINSSTGEVNFVSSWSGTSTVTATAIGCGSNQISTHQILTSSIIAVDDIAVGVQGTPLLINVLGNDLCDVVPSTLTIINQPVYGLIQINALNQVVYLPIGDFYGDDNFIYRICASDGTCDTATVEVTIEEVEDNPCLEANMEKIYYLPFPENEAQLKQSLLSAASLNILTDQVRSITSIITPYPRTLIIYDHWEDGYEVDISNPSQSTTQIWGDGDLTNGVAPGYPSDILPPGANILLDNSFNWNRPTSTIVFDGKDKIFTSANVSISKISGDAGFNGATPLFDVQSVKTNVEDISRFGQLFILPLGENVNFGNTINSFNYTGLFVRATENNTIINLDLNGDGSIDVVSPNLNEGQVWFYNGQGSTPGVTTDINTSIDIKAGTIVTANNPIGVDLVFGGIDSYGTRNTPVYPGSYYGNTYLSPVYSTNVNAPIYAIFVNPFPDPMTINWTRGSGAPTSGTLIVPGNSGVNFFNMNNATGYRFQSADGRPFTALAVVDADLNGSAFDWAFTMLPSRRLTTFATVAWAPGSSNNSANYNPVWVTPTANTTIYVKWDGNVTSGPLLSPCGARYDQSYTLNALESRLLFNPSSNDNTGMAIYTCNNTPISAVWGQRPFGTTPEGSPAIDVGYTMGPFCLGNLVFATRDNVVAAQNSPININVLNNDSAFLCFINPSSVTISTGPSNGSVVVNPDGTVTYTPNPGFVGEDGFSYIVCAQSPYESTCDVAKVSIRVPCALTLNSNVINGVVYRDNNYNGQVNIGENGMPNIFVQIYNDLNGNGILDIGEPIISSQQTLANGSYEFILPQNFTYRDSFNTPYTASANASNGTLSWTSQAWTETNDNNNINSGNIFVNASGQLRVQGNGASTQASVARTANLSNSVQAYLTFDYSKSAFNNAVNDWVDIQVSASNSGPWVTLKRYSGTGAVSGSESFDISNYISANTTIRFIESNDINFITSEFVTFDNLEIRQFRNVNYIIKLQEPIIQDFYQTSTPSEFAVNFAGANFGSCANNFGIAPFRVVTQDDINLTQAGISITGNLLNNDTYAVNINNVNIGGISIPLNANYTIPGVGVINISTNGDYTFLPNAGFVGNVTNINYVASNATETSSDSATLFLQVTQAFDFNQNNPPIANNDTGTVEHFETITINPLLNDVDIDGDILNLVQITYNGAIIPSNAGSPLSIRVSGVEVGFAYVDAFGQLIFNATNENFVGDVIFNYQINDGHSLTDNASINITILPSQLFVIYANDDLNMKPQGVSMFGQLFTNDQLTGTNPSINSAGLVYDGQTYNFTVGTPLNIPNVGQIVINSNGTYSFNPVYDFVGTLPISYTVCNVEVNCDSANLYLISHAQVIAQNDINHTVLNTAISGNVLTNDSNATQVLQANQGGTNIPIGTLTDILGGSILLNADGSYVFTPNTDYSGTVPQINYTASNNANSSNDTANLHLIVLPNYSPINNNLPIALNDTAFLEINNSISVNPLLNDSDIDGDTLNVTQINYQGTPISVVQSSPTPIMINGEIIGNAYMNWDGTLVYTSTSNYTGNVDLTYQITDNNGGFANALIIITITDDYFDPIIHANDDSNIAPQGESLSGNVLTNDQLSGTNPSVNNAVAVINGTNYPISIGSPITIPNVGQLTLNVNGTYTLDPINTFIGTLPINYSVCNTENLCSSATLYLTAIEPLCINPNVPTIGTITQATCSVLTGSVVIDNLPLENWTLTRLPDNVTYTGNTSSITINGLPVNATYQFFVTLAAGCSSDNSTDVVINPLIPVDATLNEVNNPSGCGLGDGSLVFGNLQNGASYILNYNRNGQAQSPINFTTTSTNYTLAGLTAGNYTNVIISYTDASCSSTPFTANLVNPTPATISIVNTVHPSICSGNDGSIVISGLAPGQNYMLFYMRNSINQTPISFTATGVSYTLSGLTSSIYSNIRVISNSCVSNFVSTTLNDPAGPSITLNSFVNPSLCGANDGAITISGLIPGENYIFRYRFNGINQEPFSFISNGVSHTINNLGAGNYTNIVVSLNGCISNRLGIELFDPIPPILTLAGSVDPIFCGDSNGSITIVGLSNGINYTLNYVRNGVQQSAISFTATGTSYILSNLSAGIYTGITVSIGSCISNVVEETLNDPSVMIDVQEIDVLTCVPGNEGKLIITGLVPGQSYTLTYNRNGIAQTPINIVNSSTTSYVIDNLIIANYTDIKVLTGGCESNSVSTALAGPVVALPNVSNTNLTIICPNNFADLTTITASNSGMNQLTWHTDILATSLNQITDIDQVGVGIYYAALFNPMTGCYSQTVNVTVDYNCPSPIAQIDINQTQLGVLTSGNVLTNDDNAVNVTAASQGGTPITIGTPTAITGGTITINADGTYTFVPAPGFEGTVPAISYTVENADGSATDIATLNIVVIAPFDPSQNNDPIANADTANVEQGETVTVNPLLNDADLDGDTLTVTQITGLDNAGNPLTLTSTPQNVYDENGVLAGQASIVGGNLVFTAEPTYTGDVPFAYETTDGNGGNADSTINVTVVAPTGSPEVYVNDDANAAPQGQTQTGDVLANDQLSGTNPVVTTANVNGTPLTIGTPTTIPGVGDVTLNADGTYTFVPEPTFVGTLPVEYTVCNDEGSCDTATLYLTSVKSCSIAPNTDAPDGFTNVGISTLENKRTEWPNDVPNGFIALESKEKGFVITRTTSASIASPVEGMLIYDTTDNCFKLYNGTTWNCIAKSCN